MLEQTYVSGYITDFTKWISLIVIPVVMTTELYVVFDTVEEHFTTNDGCCTSKGTHCHFPSTTLQKSTQAALLTLCRIISRSWHNPR
jgi:hypothetical protein